MENEQPLDSQENPVEVQETPEVSQVQEATEPAEGLDSSSLRIPEAAERPEGLSTDFLNPFYEEFAKSGKLSDESLAALEAKGIPREITLTHMEAVATAQRANVETVLQAVGGREMADQVMQWAATNLSKEEVASINSDLARASVPSAIAILQGLASRAKILPQGTRPSSGKNLAANPFPNDRAYNEAVLDPKYKSSEEYRLQVHQRLRASVAAGTIKL